MPEDNNLDLGNNILRRFVGAVIHRTCIDKYQLRIVFGSGEEFVTSSPWRILLHDSLVGGGGDAGGLLGTEMLASFEGVAVKSVAMEKAWDTRFIFENNYALEVIPDSVQFEAWEAHTQDGWSIFVGGELTLFPASPSLPANSGELIVYGTGAYRVEDALIKAVTSVLSGAEGLHSVGLATSSQSKCPRSHTGESNAFDVVEVNGIPIERLRQDSNRTKWLQSIQLFAANRGARESYGPAGLFQNGSQVMVPELQARFTNYIHIRLGAAAT